MPVRTLRSRSRLGRLLAILGLLVVLMAQSQPTAEAARGRHHHRIQPSFYGLTAQALFSLPADQWDAQLTKLASTGVGRVRFGTVWASVEPQPPTNGVHHYDWSRIDRITEALARHHLRGAPVIGYSTGWAALNPNEPDGHWFSPPNVTMYAAFARAVADRYSAGGAFWTSHPELPQLPIKTYEIWNEENLESFFHGTDPSLYAALYAAARDGIHQVDPNAVVTVGGLAAPLRSIPWLRGFIAALPADGHEIDAIGWHPYYSTPREVYVSLRRLNRLLSARKLHPRIELTEVNGFDKQRQPYLVRKLVRTLPRSNCHVHSMVVHTWTPLAHDSPPTRYAIASTSEDLNATGLAFRSAVHRAERRGVVRKRIC